MTRNTCILLFTRTADREAEHKSFLTGKSNKQNRVVANALINSTLRKIRQSQIPFQVYYDCEEEGKGFGNKLSRATEAIFDLGFQHVIILGNDCPGLQVSDLTEAQKRLEQGKVVIGPAKDGGSYLIGLSTATFSKPCFEKMDWQTNNFFQSLLEYTDCFKIAETHLLVTRGDVDNANALRAQMRFFRFCYDLRAVLHLIIGLPTTPFLLANQILNNRFLYSFVSYRGPPSY